MNTATSDLKSIFGEALVIQSRSDRDAYVAEACGQNSELRAQVASLLAAAEKAGSFMAGPAVASSETQKFPGVSERSGTVIGPYKLLQQIGEGGMGVVFMAEQAEPIQRTVALKIIKPGMDTRQVTARFEAERQALAMMDHPNIAKVLDAGTTETGRPYFVMELVKGVPITKYCDEKHLSLRERLELFVPVCQAVQHAHQKGIIHRDIKPNNVLVAEYDNRAVPKVIDFGVAKATAQRLTERTMFTEFGQVLGTMEYMSPEQSKFNQLDIDTRSDIYSLGVLLYELLAGSTPFEGKRLKEAAYDEMLRIIREEEPPKPSTRLSSLSLGDGAGVGIPSSLASIAANRHTEPARLSKDVQGELDWIVMKALEKDRNRRYESASGFAADIERHLHDEPVEAGPPSAAYRFRKFAHRNKAALVTASLALLAILLITATAGWAVRDRQNRQAAVAARAEQVLGESEALYRQRKLPEAMQLARNALTLMEGGAGDPAVGRRARAWLKDLDMVTKLEGLHPATGDSEEGGWAVTRAEYAKAFQQYGIDVEALAPAEAAAQIAARPIRVDLAVSLDRWGYFLLPRRHVPSEKETALGIRLRQIAGLADPDPLRSQLREYKLQEDAANVEKIAASLDLATTPIATLLMLGDAHAWPDPMIAFYTRLQQHHPDDFAINFLLGEMLFRGDRADRSRRIRFLTAAVSIRPGSVAAHSKLAEALWTAGMVDEAIFEFREAIRLGATGGEVWMGLAQALLIQGNKQEAIAAYHAADLSEASDTNLYLWMGGMYARFSRKDAVLAAYREGLQTKPDDAALHLALANELANQKLLDQALVEYRETLRAKPNDAMLHYNVGNELAKQGLVDEALVAYLEALRVKPDDAVLHYQVGIELAKQGLVDEAIAAHRQVIRLNPGYTGAHLQLGSELKKKGLRDEAMAAYREVVRLKPADAYAHNNDTLVGWVLAEEDLLEEVITLYREAARRAPENAVAHADLGFVMERKGRLDEAISSYREAVRLSPADRDLQIHLGNLYGKSGQWDKAAGPFNRAAALYPDHWGVRYQAAALSFYTGDTENYRRICRLFIDATDRAVNPPISESIVRTCALAPGFGADPQRVMNLLKVAMRGSERYPDRQQYEFTQGLVDYRAGRFAAAAEMILHAAPSVDGNGGSTNAFLILAMAQHRLGKRDESRNSFENAQRIIDTKMPKIEKGETFGDAWGGWMRTQIFYREAEQVMKEPTPSSQKSN